MCHKLRLEGWKKSTFLDVGRGKVNGKLRGQIEVAIDADELQIREQVLANEKIGRHIGESKIKRFIVVPQKLVNVVI